MQSAELEVQSEESHSGSNAESSCMVAQCSGASLTEYVVAEGLQLLDQLLQAETCENVCRLLQSHCADAAIEQAGVRDVEQSADNSAVFTSSPEDDLDQLQMDRNRERSVSRSRSRTPLRPASHVRDVSLTEHSDPASFSPIKLHIRGPNPESCPHTALSESERNRTECAELKVWSTEKCSSSKSCTAVQCSDVLLTQDIISEGLGLFEQVLQAKARETSSSHDASVVMELFGARVMEQSVVSSTASIDSRGTDLARLQIDHNKTPSSLEQVEERRRAVELELAQLENAHLEDFCSLSLHVAELRNKLSRAEISEHDALRASESKSQVISQLESFVLALKQKIVNLECDRASAIQTADGLVRSVSVLKKQLADSECDNFNSVENLKRQLREANNEIGTLKHDNFNSVENLKRQLREANNEIGTLKHKLAQLESSNTGRICTNQGFVWQFEVGNGKWSSMSADANEELLKAYVPYIKDKSIFFHKTEFCSAGHMYIADFRTMTQVNPGSKTSRSIRLICEKPDEWISTPEMLFTQTHSQSMYHWEHNDAVWTSLEKLLKDTAHGHSNDRPHSKCPCMQSARIREVWRIENFALWRSYLQHIRTMELLQAQDEIKAGKLEPLVGILDPCLSSDVTVLSGSYSLNHAVNETFLFHGTMYDHADGIVTTGLDHRVNRHGMYGAGTYFASQSCKSHQYTCAKHNKGCGCSGQRTMIVARVALGDPYYTQKICKELKRPPRRDNYQRLHDCIVANVGPMSGHHRGYQDHQEFLVFNDSQAYPSFIIQYEV